MNIQRGDNRQYLPQGIAKQSMAGNTVEALSQSLSAGISTVQKANQSDLSSKQIDLASEWYKKNNEINLKYQSDPTNPQRDVDLSEAFSALSEKYRVNPLVEKQWSDIKQNVFDRTKMYNAQWAEQQQQTNATQNLKNGYEKLINQVSMLGMEGRGIDDIRLVYSNGIDALRNGANAVLGEVVTNDFLNDSTHDFMTTYISALAQNNPLSAQKLLEDKGVLGDIGRAETIEKLKSYVETSLANQSKRAAFDELGATLRAMSSEDARTILEGRADLTKVMKFVESNKKLPEGSKDLILGIYGIGSTTEYVYDRDKKRIVKKDEAGTRKTSANKMSPLEKKMCAEALESDLHNMLSFDDIESIDVEDVKKNKKEEEASNFLVNYMKKVAFMQGRIDSAYNAGAIDKSTRNRMINQYISPVADYLESNLEQLDEKSINGFMGPKLGYDKIKKEFDTKNLTGKELRERETQKLFAQNYYLDELYNIAAKTPGLKNIYSIESLPSRQQQEIYKTASENAIKRAKRWADRPELFFAQEYPDVYSEPFVFFKQDKALAITRTVAKEVYKRQFEAPGGGSSLDLADFAKSTMFNEINKQAKINRIKAGDTLNLLREDSAAISRPAPKNLDEFYSRVRALGLDPQKFMQDARDRGFLRTPNMSASDRWRYAQKQVLGQIDPMAGYWEALREAEHAYALKNKRK